MLANRDKILSSVLTESRTEICFLFQQRGALMDAHDPLHPDFDDIARRLQVLEREKLGYFMELMSCNEEVKESIRGNFGGCRSGRRGCCSS
jgi:hypothetical protein